MKAKELESPITPEEILESMNAASRGYERGLISQEVFSDLAVELAERFFALPEVALPSRLSMLKDMRREAILFGEAITVAYLERLIKDVKERGG